MSTDIRERYDVVLLIEQPLVMPKTWISLGTSAFRETDLVDPVTPEERNGVITFGTANNPHKYGAEMLRVWARVLQAVPNSRFLFVRPEGGTRAFRENMQAIFASEGVAVDPQAKEHIWSALGSLASAPMPERTLTGLAVLLQSQQLKQALASYCIGGPWGRLLDAESERLGEASVQAFETEGLVGAGSAAAVLSYLFHRIEGRLDGSPTLIIIDEGWLVLDSPAFAAQLREWLKTLRKKNASVIFATQSLADIETSAIAPAIIESCPTRIFLPNERAAEPQIAAIYERFGLNARQIEILSRATPKRDYYCQSRRGNRLFELGLGEVALAFAAASAKTDQLAIAEIIETHGAPAFAAEWLRHRGCAWAVELLPDPVSDREPELPLTPDMEIEP